MKKRRKIKKKSFLRKFFIMFLVISILGIFGTTYELYSRIFQPNIVFSNNITEKYIYIPTAANFFQVLTILSEYGLLINSN